MIDQGSDQTILTPGNVLHGRYEIVKSLGAGANGHVTLAKDLQLGGQLLALKALYAHLLFSEDSYTRFRLETRVMMTLSHPHIVSSFGMDREPGGICYLKMEYCENASVAALLAQQGDQHLEFAVLYRLLAEIASGLAYAHSCHIIHRDLKPENILLNKAGRALIGDFGLAQLIRKEARYTGYGHIAGTPNYMAPEQLSGGIIDTRSDIYSFGILAFELTTGKKPFAAETFWALADQHINCIIPDITECRPETPEWLVQLIKTCVQKDRSDRYTSMDDVLATLLREAPEELVGIQAATLSTREATVVSASEQHAPEIILINRRLRLLIELGLKIGLAIFFILPPWVNSSIAWRYGAIGLRAERILGFKLVPLRYIFHVDQRLTYPATYFDNTVPFHWKYSVIWGGFDPNVFDETSGDWAIHSVLKTSQPRLITMFLDLNPRMNVRSKDGATPLLYTINSGFAPSALQLLARGADPNIGDSKGNTPLHAAARGGRVALMIALIDAGGDLRAENDDGDTPLHLAVVSGSAEAVRLLLDRGSNPAVRNHQGALPRTIAETHDLPSIRERLLQLLPAQ